MSLNRWDLHVATHLLPKSVGRDGLTREQALRWSAECARAEDRMTEEGMSLKDLGLASEMFEYLAKLDSIVNYPGMQDRFREAGFELKESRDARDREVA